VTLGRRKGSEAEREVAALLGAWWQAVEPGCQFVRTPLSGGWGGPKLRGEFQASGDVMTTANTFPFSVEVKRREDWSWVQFVTGKQSPVWTWWTQAEGQAKEMKKEPMLWLRQNKKEWYVVLPAPYRHLLALTYGVPRHHEVTLVPAKQMLTCAAPRFVNGGGTTRRRGAKR